MPNEVSSSSPSKIAELALPVQPAEAASLRGAGAEREPAKRTPRISHHDPRLGAPELYLNRELTWLEFNKRVLFEAADHRNALLERIKFLAITASNLDEF